MMFMEIGRTDDQRRKWCERGRRETIITNPTGNMKIPKETQRNSGTAKDTLVFIFINSDTCNSIQTHDSIYT